jgi:hypothetical protein
LGINPANLPETVEEFNSAPAFCVALSLHGGITRKYMTNPAGRVNLRANKY